MYSSIAWLSCSKVWNFCKQQLGYNDIYKNGNYVGCGPATSKSLTTLENYMDLFMNDNFTIWNSIYESCKYKPTTVQYGDGAKNSNIESKKSGYQGGHVPDDPTYQSNQETSDSQVPWYNDALNAGIDFINGALDNAYEASSYISPYTQAGMNFWKDYSPIYWVFQYSTQEGWFSEAFDLGGFYRDEKGVYHAKQSDSLQSWKYAGYNNLYDGVFNSATSMAKEKFEFSYDGKEYILWAWKGDYLNLGAGAEMGIYTRMEVDGKPTEHWLVDQNLAMPMTLTLDYEGKQIISYDPRKDDPKGQNTNKWWVTGFNPYYQDKKASELTATFTIDFSGKEGMYNAFIKSDSYLDNIDKWSISKDNKYLLTFKF